MGGNIRFGLMWCVWLVMFAGFDGMFLIRAALVMMALTGLIALCSWRRLVIASWVRRYILPEPEAPRSFFCTASFFACCFGLIGFVLYR